MNRRDTLLALVALGVAPLAARAQRPAKPARIAWLGLADPEAAKLGLDTLKQGLRELDYLEGRDFVLDFRWALGKAERLPDLAKELVALHPDVILVTASGPTRAAQQATTTIPIIMVGVNDPVGVGFVKSLARSQETCQSSSRPSSNWSSTAGPPRRWASLSRPNCCYARTR
jgi:putative ABC transport system substrate-binding protein